MRTLALLLLPALCFGFRLSTPPLELDECRSNIYCQGELLHDVQLSGIFEDSKTFVDKKLLYSVKKINDEYKALKTQFKGVVPNDDLKNFIERNFENGKELEEWSPTDWVQKPSVLTKISDQELNQWAENLNHVWKNLSRRIIKDVGENPEMYSLMYVPNGFVIPGGRFRELYYWDTYWIVNGLLKCDMVKTGRGVIENLASLVETLGYVPNGNRVYYKGRSQPPMLTLMIDSYYSHTKDLSIIKYNIDALDKEMNFWLTKRSIVVEKNGIPHTLFHYNVSVDLPRPESYKEDLMTVKLMDEDKQEEGYRNIRSAAESGWDFSTRWFILNGENHGNLSNIATNMIIPVDLNALLQKDFALLSKMYGLLRNKAKEKHYEILARKLKEAIKEVLWNEGEGIWLDYDVLNGKSRNYLYLSNFVPLWTGSYSFKKDYITKRVLDYIERNNLEQYIGGIPTSLEYSGEQWDYPNAWPPLQAFLIQGLDRIRSEEASSKALSFAQKWIYSNYKSFKDSKAMYEKYNALTVGQTGHGGEYVPQEGFGWTNGVVFEFLSQWGAQLKAYEQKVN